ncbi:EamA family transporter [Streptomyces sp. NBC_00198]|uniref:EamA family transporter n=1 Tax=Streptomyces sp. NBC_00198 TaxID=2975677 RepID=UPI00224F150D|nr:EamA family transporter [Streptomyces sp. NBC_00198]MCX5284702.1 EamA family transporter [Streptomyces sp. NBC_00198]
MTVRDRLLAVLVAVLWGLNFLAVRVGLDHYPPFFLSALRFVVLAVPVIVFVPRPKVPLRWLVIYGLGFGAMQFGLLFLAIDQGMPSGQASVVVQASAPFTMLLGALLLGERISRRQLAGVAVAVVGMSVIAVERARSAALLPLLLTLLAALGWAFGNVASRQARPDHPLRFALWMSVVPPLPLLALSAAMEGPGTGWRDFGASFSADGWPGLVALVYTALAGSVVGSGIWTTLLKRYEAGKVAPFSMLVPVVAVLAAWLALGEQPTAWSAIGGAAVVAGVLVGTGWNPFRRRGAAARQSVGPVPVEGGGAVPAQPGPHEREQPRTTRR